MFETTEKRLWRGLIRQGCTQAALGLLYDLFEMVDHTARDDQQQVRAHYREAVMEIIEDKDGDKLASWLQLYQTDAKAFALQVEQWEFKVWTREGRRLRRKLRGE